MAAPLSAWLHAFRLRTLPLAVSSIIVGSALAFRYAQEHPGSPSWRWEILVLALCTAILLQILSNLANDLGDHQHGTDNAERVGPQRAVQSGAITPAQMKRAMIICGTLAFLCGCALITVALGTTLTTLIFLLIGLAAIGAAVKYTFGSNPYGYAGLGDISVFLFFGIVGVYGSFFLHTGVPHPWVIKPACAFGLLSAGVLNVNNMRDIHNDAACGKRTLVVRLGLPAARILHTGLLLGAILFLLEYIAWNFSDWPSFLFLATMPLLIMHLVRVWTTAAPSDLDPQLKVLAMGTFLTALLFALGLILA